MNVAAAVVVAAAVIVAAAVVVAANGRASAANCQHAQGTLFVDGLIAKK